MEIAEAIIFAVIVGVACLDVRYLAQLKARESAVPRIAGQHSLTKVMVVHSSGGPKRPCTDDGKA